MVDTDVLSLVYASFADTGRPPTLDALAAATGSAAEARRSLQRLHDDHLLVLVSGSIRMALPFSAVPTGHVVDVDGLEYDANCAWDALAIPITLATDARVDACYADTGDPVDLAVINGSLSHTAGFVNFLVPASAWWDDIVFT